MTPQNRTFRNLGKTARSTGHLIRSGIHWTRSADTSPKQKVLSVKPISSFSAKLGILVTAFSCATLLSFAQVAHIKEAPDDKTPLTPQQKVSLAFSVTGLPDDAYLISASCNYLQGNNNRRNYEAPSGPIVSIELHPDQSDKKTVSGSGKIPDDATPGDYTLRGCILQFNSERLRKDGEPDFDGPVRFDPPLTIHVKK